MTGVHHEDQEINATPDKTMTQVINICEAGEKEVAYFLATHRLPLKPLQNPHCFECLNFCLTLLCMSKPLKKFWEACVTRHALQGLLAKTKS